MVIKFIYKKKRVPYLSELLWQSRFTAVSTLKKFTPIY